MYKELVPTKFEEDLLEFASQSVDKSAVIKFRNGDYIIVQESTQVENYLIMDYPFSQFFIPIIHFEKGKYETFTQSGLILAHEAEPQLSSLASVVDMHYGDFHYFE